MYMYISSCLAKAKFTQLTATPECEARKDDDADSLIHLPIRTKMRMNSKQQLIIIVTGSKKTNHFVIMQFAQYGPKALPGHEMGLRNKCATV